MTDPRIAVLLHLGDQAFDRSSWHGTNLRNSLRGLDVEALSWRPQPKRHNVWEIAVHTAYWKYRVYRLVSGGEPRTFGTKGSDWLPRPVEATEAAWQEDLALIEAWHERLRAAVEAFDPDRLDERPGKSPYTFEGLIVGAASHDLYHAGQIQLIKRLFSEGG